jgi:NTE family protein
MSPSDGDAPKAAPSHAHAHGRRETPMKVLVLQGGGALGSYQAGVVEGLQATELEPDWIAGISIGAINAALIAGNPPERRLERLHAFWEQATSGPFFSPTTGIDAWRALMNQASAATVATFGAPGFFTPRFPPPMLWPPNSQEAISFYDTTPLRATLERLVDFDRINTGVTRLSVGAVNVQTGGSVVFDSAEQTLGPEHVMASGAMPPGFPPVWIEGEAYWDGGLVSNTPLQFVLDAEQTRDLLIFQVDLFNAHGPMPANLSDVDEREKDIRFSSRTRLNTDASLHIHQIKAAIRKLLTVLPEGHGHDAEVALLNDAAQENAVTVVQLIYRKRPYEGGSKDYEFSRQTMTEHWASGLADVRHFLDEHGDVLTQPPAAGTRVMDAGRVDHGAYKSLFS